MKEHGICYYLDFMSNEISRLIPPCDPMIVQKHFDFYKSPFLRSSLISSRFPVRLSFYTARESNRTLSSVAFEEITAIKHPEDSGSLQQGGETVSIQTGLENSGKAACITHLKAPESLVNIVLLHLERPPFGLTTTEAS
jgi:hypothetical protein